MGRLGSLLRFHKDREVNDAELIRPVRAVRLWSRIGLNDEKIDKLKDLAASGRRLEILMESPVWQDVLGAKRYYQRLYDGMTKMVSVSHEDRLKAACEWSAIEGLFSELNRRVKAGREAQERLDKARL